MSPIELCFSLHMDRLWRKAPSFAANRATRALKLPLSGHKEPQAAAAGGLTSETDGLGRKESGFGNGQQDRGVGARVRARGVHGAGQRARARALLPVPGEGGGLAPRGDGFTQPRSYVEVDSIDETVVKAEAAGATVAMAKQPITDTSWWAVIVDPDGNHIGLFEGSTGV